MVILQSEQFIQRYPDPTAIEILDTHEITNNTEGKIISRITFMYKGQPYIEVVYVDQDQNCDAKDTALSWLFWQRKIFGPKTPPELLEMSHEDWVKNIYKLCYTA